MVEVETERHLKLLPLSTIDIYNVFEHIDMLFIGIQQQQSYTAWLRVWGFGSLVESN
jgi:hypothetical protein